MIKILGFSRKHFGQGGPKRIGTALPPLVVAAYQLAGEFYKIRETVIIECQVLFHLMYYFFCLKYIYNNLMLR